MKTYLVIDQGNTSTKIALGDTSSILHKWIWNANTEDSVKEMISRLKPELALFSSVGGEAQNRPELHLQGMKVLNLDSNTPVPIKNRYETPATLGYDRLADAVGAWKIYPYTDSLVVDFGTCINYEFVNSAGEYLGGAISPGMRMRFRALNNYTGKLPMIDEHFQPDHFVGNDTTTSMLSGVMNGILQEVDGVIGQYIDRYGEINVLVTGGDADYFAKYLKNKTFAQPDLALAGLLEILRYIDEGK